MTEKNMINTITFNWEGLPLRVLLFGNLFSAVLFIVEIVLIGHAVEPCKSAIGKADTSLRMRMLPVFWGADTKGITAEPF